MMACARWGQPKYSKDAIQEFEMVTSRFDATQGRSTNVQVNAVTKAGTNRFGGTTSGYSRSDKFNSKDFLAHKVLPYSDQQFSTTYGGPIIKDKLHFFGYYDGERNPLTITYTSLYPSFNNVLDDFSFKKTDHKMGARVDNQYQRQHPIHDSDERLEVHYAGLDGCRRRCAPPVPVHHLCP